MLARSGEGLLPDCGLLLVSSYGGGLGSSVGLF